MTKPDSGELAHALLAIGCTAIEVVEECARDGALAPSLGAAAGAWLGPLGIVAGAVAGLAVNRLASALDRRAEARDAARALLNNEDIARVQSAAIAARIDKVRSRVPWYRRPIHRRLKKLAGGVPEWWPQIVRDQAQRWLDGMRDEELVETLTNHLATEHRTTPGRAAWLLVVIEAEKRTSRTLDADTRGRLAEELAQHFVADTFEALKSDSRAFASAVLRFLAEILVEARKGAAPDPRLDEAVAQLTKAARALEILEQLPVELRELRQEVKESKDAALGARSAALGARDAALGAKEISQATFELVRERVQPVRTPPCQLPPAAREFFGRKHEIEQLGAFLRDPQPNCYVVGIAGMGKTALAAEAIAALVGGRGERLADSHFSDGVVFLDAYYLKRPDAVWSTLVALFDPAMLVQGGQPREAARRVCLGKRLLVVIEGAEELDDPGDVISVLDAQTKRLVLTRNREQIEAGRFVDLKEVLGEEDALALLRGLAPNSSEGLLSELHVRLGGHPYALTMAGGQLGLEEESPDALLSELLAQDFPALYAAGDPKRTLEWLFGRSLRRLDTDARALLAAVGVLALGPVPLSAAQASLGDPDEKRARAAMKALVRHSWMRLASTAPESWQAAHVLAYQFARALELPDDGVVDRAREWAVERLRESLRRVRQLTDLVDVRAAARHAFAAAPCGRVRHELDASCSFLLYDARDRLRSLGMMDEVRACIEAAAAGLERVAPARRSASWSRERSVAWNRLGDVQLAQGDLANVRTSYTAAKEIAQKLAAADPTNAEWQRDLCVSFTKLGDVQLAQGDLTNARASHTAAKEIAQRLAATDPANAKWQRDLNVSSNRLGDVQLAQGDLANASASYTAAKEIAQRLAAADPTNAQWQWDLSVSLTKLGDVRLAQGDLANASASYTAAKEIMQNLAMADPTNAAWQRDLGVSCTRLGDVQLRQGDLANARVSYAAAEEIKQKLAAADQTNTEWQRDLVVSHASLGALARRTNDVGAARAYFENGLRIAGRLSALDPSNVQWRNDVAWLRAQIESL